MEVGNAWLASIAIKNMVKVRFLNPTHVMNAIHSSFLLCGTSTYFSYWFPMPLAEEEVRLP